MSYFPSFSSYKATSWKNFAEKYPKHELANKINTSPWVMTQAVTAIKENMNDPAIDGNDPKKRTNGEVYRAKYNLPEEALNWPAVDNDKEGGSKKSRKSRKTKGGKKSKKTKKNRKTKRRTRKH